MKIQNQSSHPILSLILATFLWGAPFLSPEARAESYGAALSLQTMSLGAPVPKDGTKYQEWKCEMKCGDGENFEFSINVRVPVRQTYEILEGDIRVPKYCFPPSDETIEAASKAYCDNDVKSYSCKALGTDGKDHDCSVLFL